MILMDCDVALLLTKLHFAIIPELLFQSLNQDPIHCSYSYYITAVLTAYIILRKVKYNKLKVDLSRHGFASL